MQQHTNGAIRQRAVTQLFQAVVIRVDRGPDNKGHDMYLEMQPDKYVRRTRFQVQLSKLPAAPQNYPPTTDTLPRSLASQMPVLWIKRPLQPTKGLKSLYSQRSRAKFHLSGVFYREIIYRTSRFGVSASIGDDTMDSKTAGITLAAFVAPMFLVAVSYETEIKKFLGTDSFSQTVTPGLFEPGQLLYFTSPG